MATVGLDEAATGSSGLNFLRRIAVTRKKTKVEGVQARHGRHR